MVTNENNIALFIDIENLIRSAVEIALPIDLSPITNKLLEHGRLSLRRGFGDLDAACRGDRGLRMQMRRMIHENLVQFEDIPYMTKFKNSADMRLAVEALSVAYSYPDINYFAIVAADRDYVPLIAKLKELGKKVIGIGTSVDTVHEIYVKSCDVFIYYSSLFPSNGQADQAFTEQGDQSLLDIYVQLLVQATSALLQKGSKPVGALLVPLMRQLRPDFDLKLVQLESLRDLAAVAEERKLMTVLPSGGDILLQLSANSESLAEVSRSIPRVDSSDPAAAQALYMKFIGDKMKCPLPSRAVREKIYDLGYNVIAMHRARNATVTLVELSTKIFEQLDGEGSGAATQSMIFKVFYTLYRARTFESEMTDRPYNPTIKSSMVPPDQWDHYLIRNTVRIIARERSAWQLLEEPLANIFETTPDVITEMIKPLRD